MRIHCLRIVNFIVKSLSRRNYLNSQAILVTGPDFSYNQSVTPKNKSFLQCFLRFFRIYFYHYILYLDFVKMYFICFTLNFSWKKIDSSFKQLHQSDLSTIILRLRNHVKLFVTNWYGFTVVSFVNTLNTILWIIYSILDIFEVWISNSFFYRKVSK